MLRYVALLRTDVVSSSLILVTLIMEALRSSDTSVLTRAARRNNPENCILQYSFDLWHSNIFQENLLPTLL
jgi:hypothetical protein